jgi:hypothetical protein
MKNILHKNPSFVWNDYVAVNLYAYICKNIWLPILNAGLWDIRAHLALKLYENLNF